MEEYSCIVVFKATATVDVEAANPEEAQKLVQKMTHKKLREEVIKSGSDFFICSDYEVLDITQERNGKYVSV